MISDSSTIKMTNEEEIQAEINNAKGMKISELKMKLMAKGVLTTTFLEKEEFVRAYAELVVKDGKNSGFSGLLQTDLNTENDNDNDDDDDDDDDDDQPINEEVPKYMKLRVEKLTDLHEEREVLMEQYLKERAAIEAKYEALSRPFYEKRTKIISGELDSKIAVESATNNELPVTSDKESDDQQDTGIPLFWCRAISHMPVTADLVKEQDLESLAPLKDVRCVNYENGKGFILEFEFGKNDFFENKVLYKSYDVPNLLLADEPILKNVIGTDIKWKPHKNLTVTTVCKQQRGKGKNVGVNRTVSKVVQRDSFFHFFTPPKMPSLETTNEEEVMRVEAAFNDDYDIAQAFRSHIIPKAVLWFSGDALEQEMDAAMEGMEWPTAEVFS